LEAIFYQREHIASLGKEDRVHEHRFQGTMMGKKN